MSNAPSRNKAKPNSSKPSVAPASTSDNVKVVVRIRPSNESEKSDKYHNVTEAISDHMLVFDPKVHNSMGFLTNSRRDLNRRRFKDLKYAFDYVFGPTATNKDVFEKTTGTIVKGLLNGYNCSVFAYGATGAGKTHTMLGDVNEPGVIYYTMIDLYKKINEQREERHFDVAVSYSEIYNEQVHDLLMPKGNLPIREDKTVGVIIAGLSLHKPKSADELLHMLHFGNQNRTQHPTDANAESSRSHAVFQVFVNQREKLSNLNSEVRMAKMCLVDLAGSERAIDTKNRGARFREGANINRSLLALGNVINALADNKYKGHIPYRDSKLTRLLKDSLGGNCRTVMIAAVSPSSRSFEDTYNTLRYADRAKQIKAELKKNVMNVDFHVANYKKHVQDLEKENTELRKAKQKLLEELNLKDTPATYPPVVKELQEKLLELVRARKEIRKAQMAADGAKRELKWKVSRKEQTIKRVQKLTDSMHIIGKQSRIVERMKRRIEKEDGELKLATKRIQDEEGAIQSMYTEAVQTAKNACCSPEILDLTVKMHTAEANLYDTSMYLAFVKKMARAQERQASVNEKLISCLLLLVKKQQNILQSRDLLNEDLRTRYEQCCYLVEERGVAWVQGQGGASPADQNVMDEVNEKEEDLRMSDIIDIQFPRLEIRLQRSDSSCTNAKSSDSTQSLPQRVAKPTFAVKPASRLTGMNGGENQSERNNPSDSQLNRPLFHQRASNPPSNLHDSLINHNALSHLVRTQSPQVESSVDKPSPSRQLMTNNNVRTSTGHNPQANPQISLNDNHHQLFYTNTVSVPNANFQHSRYSEKASRQLQQLSLEREQLHGLKRVVYEEDSKSDSMSNADLNDTFEVLKPALPNTPIIDNSQRSSFYHKQNVPSSMSNAVPHYKGPHGPSKNVGSWVNQTVYVDAGISPTYSKTHGQNSPTMTSLNTANHNPPKHSPPQNNNDEEKHAQGRLSMEEMWTSVCRNGHDAQQQTIRQRAQDLSPAKNVKSPSHNRQSPSPVTTPTRGRQGERLFRSRSLHDDEPEQQRRRRPPFLCSNSNNANITDNFGASLYSSPTKSYADAVKSPVSCTKALPQRVYTPQAKAKTTSMPQRIFTPGTPPKKKRCDNENVYKIKTPDFSSSPQIAQMFDGSKKQEICLTKSLSSSSLDRADKPVAVCEPRREALRPLTTNVQELKYSSNLGKIEEEKPLGKVAPWKQTQPGVGKSLTTTKIQNRAMPYTIDRTQRKQTTSSQELATGNKVNLPRRGSLKQRSYMLPTKSTAQRILKVEQEKKTRKDTGTLRQPYSIPQSIIANGQSK